MTGLQPAYLVVFSRPNHQPHQTRFTNANLLTARKAAMSHTESLWNSLDGLDHTSRIDVYLIEQPEDTADYITIAHVIRRSPFVVPGGQIAGLDTIPLEEVPAEQLQCLAKLKELNQEAHYYFRHRHTTGFGSFFITLHPQDRLAISPRIGYVLFDAPGAVYAIVASFNGYISNERGYDFRIECSTGHTDDGNHDQCVDESYNVYFN